MTGMGVRAMAIRLRGLGQKGYGEVSKESSNGLGG